MEGIEVSEEPTLATCEGVWLPEYQAVAEAAARARLVSPGSFGFSAYRHGRLIIDLVANRDMRAMTTASVVPVFSVSKGIIAFLAQRLVDDGLLGLDQTVALHVPDFAANGKADVTLRAILNHTAGLPWLPHYADLVSHDSPQSWSDWSAIREALCRAPLSWKSGTKVGYHSVTQGWLIRLIIEAALGENFQDVFRRYITDDLDCAYYLNDLPHEPGIWVDTTGPDAIDPEMQKLFTNSTAQGRALFIGPRGTLPFDTARTAAYQRFGSPSVAGLANAESIAKVYAPLANNGILNGRRVVSAKSIGVHSAVSIEQEDCIFGFRDRVALGYRRSAPGGGMFGPNDGSFGRRGIGGAVGFADPEAGIAVGYVSDHFEPGNRGLARSCQAMVDALYASHRKPNKHGARASSDQKSCGQPAAHRIEVAG